MLISAFVIAVSLAAAALLIWPRLSNARWWRATITPLASIIGSGFLVLGPVLDESYGRWAVLVMGGLCGVAYLFGAAIRFNIHTIEAQGGSRSRPEKRLETVASWALAFAYYISVAYYLNLFGEFGVSLTQVDDRFHARLLTSAIFLLILLVGWTHGFKALERLEQISVSMKLAIIAGLLMGLALFFGGKAAEGSLAFSHASLTGWPALTLGFGLLVTVQGFETSRYLGEEYDAAMRIRSMKLAQWISAGVYLGYIALVSGVFHLDDITLNETAIIDMMAVVTPVLPVLLVAAALTAQFSAAVADTSGSGGLVGELTQGKVSPRMGYVVLACVGLLLTWTADVFDVISYASRAFAIYYGLQSAIACAAAWRIRGKRGLSLLFGGLAILGAVIAVFGAPVEH